MVGSEEVKNVKILNTMTMDRSSEQSNLMELKTYGMHYKCKQERKLLIFAIKLKPFYSIENTDIF